MPEAFQTFFERLFYISEVIAKRISLRLINSSPIGLRIVGAESDTIWKFRFGHGGFHLNEHIIETADVTIASIFKQLFCLLRLAIGCYTRRKTKFRRDVWQYPQDVLFCTLQQPRAKAFVFIMGIHAPP